MHFVLSRSDYNIEAHGVRRTFGSVADASQAKCAVVGAIPFDTAEPAALTEPEELVRRDGPWRPSTPSAPLPKVTVGAMTPSLDVHVDRVRSLVNDIRDGSAQKVVLARALELRAPAPIDPLALLDALVSKDPLGNGFLADLSDARPGQYLIGASPELLVRRRGSSVTCHPFAGTAARSADPEQDSRIAETLRASAKDQAEHRFVVDEIRGVLEPLCTSIEHPRHPQLSSTPQLWHLGTPISGTLRDPSTTALELALALHPTAAVAGIPRAAAMDAIARIEGPRGFYAGAVGWTDEAGDGDWMVAIRCLELAADGLSAVAMAGGGIVAASDPDAELAETTAKFRTVLSAFGLG